VRRAPVFIVALVAAATLVGCTSPSAVAPTPASVNSQPASTELTWKQCGRGFDCATMRVPVSYSEPNGPTLGINVVRLPASGDRIGSLVVNPGGPGASGIDYAMAAQVIVSPEVLSHFDLVGFDPRGVGSSTPIHCFTGPDLDALIGADGTPDDAADLAALEDAARIVREGCAQGSPDLVGHLNTEDAARDLNQLRIALGENTLNFLGKSYGTFLGATYADLFPTYVGRFVLDGALPPDIDGDEIALGQAQGFEDALRQFMADCLTRADCPFTGDVEAAMTQLGAFIAGLETQPLPGRPNEPDRLLTEALGTYAILMDLYSANQWPDLRVALRAGLAGNGSPMMEQLDARLGRSPDGTYADNSMDAFYAYTCTDRTMTTNPSELAVLANEWSFGTAGQPAPAPLLGTYFAYANVACADWPYVGSTQAHEIHAADAAPILVVSTLHDPATPYEWGVRLAEQLDHARLVSYDGNGHTAYRKGSECVDAVVDAYLINGTVPMADVSC
jgi:pimeloyl-ACP methyl ester carboxylesterase